jgi:predicted DNA-binding protein
VKPLPKSLDQDSFTVTLNKSLHKKLKDLSKKNCRSKNKQVVYLIERAIEEDEKSHS